jgi:hypothetical protein
LPATENRRARSGAEKGANPVCVHGHAGKGFAMSRRARIVFDYQRVIDCTIRDISSTGASLNVASSLNIPSTFDLIADRDNAYFCRVIRKDESRIDVLFQDLASTQDSEI